jgi:hypothetical protein
MTPAKRIVSCGPEAMCGIAVIIGATEAVDAIESDQVA